MRWVGDAADAPLADKPAIGTLRLDTSALDVDLAHHPEIGVFARQQEIATTEAQRQVLALITSPTALGRPFVAPPDIDTERLAILRKAFADVMKDEAFTADAKSRRIDIDPMSAEEVAKIVHETINAPRPAVEIASAAMPWPIRPSFTGPMTMPKSSLPPN